MILKIVVIAIICIFLSSIIKSRNQEFASVVNICGGVIIFLLCVDLLKEIINYFLSLYEISDLNFDFISTLLKVIVVGYITEFTAEIAEDFGNKIIASKVLLGGKIVICGITIPIIKNLLSVLFLFLQ